MLSLRLVSCCHTFSIQNVRANRFVDFNLDFFIDFFVRQLLLNLSKFVSDFAAVSVSFTILHEQFLFVLEWDLVEEFDFDLVDEPVESGSVRGLVRVGGQLVQVVVQVVFVNVKIELPRHESDN